MWRCSRRGRAARPPCRCFRRTRPSGNGRWSRNPETPADPARCRVIGVSGRSRAPVLAVGSAVPEPAERDVVLPVVDPATIATIVYTSGTTGRPKGVPQSHALVMRRYARVQQILQFAADDCVATFSTVAVGQGVTALAQAWLSGETLCPFDIPRRRHRAIDRVDERAPVDGVDLVGDAAAQPDADARGPTLSPLPCRPHRRRTRSAK